MWPQRWLGELYSNLFIRFRTDLATHADIVNLSGSDGKARVAAFQLRRMGLLYVFSRVERRRLYSVADPCVIPYLSSGRISNLDKVPQGRYARLLGLFSVEILEAFPATNAIIVYGSVARGTAQPQSDIDVLILVSDSDESVGERIRKFSGIEDSGNTGRELEWLDGRGICTHISLLPLSLREAEQMPPILLDIVEDGITIADDGSFQKLRGMLRSRLAAQGIRREYLSPNEWYWVLSPELIARNVSAA